jgi:opacity protein-like surface antigen
VRKSFLIATVLAAAAATPAQAANVGVTLDVSLGNDLADYKDCAVSVPANSDGFDVLDRAVAQGCISSYDAVDYGSFGRYLTCIDEICGQDAPTWALPVPVAYVGTTWSFTLNDQYASVGLDSYVARAGDELGLTFEPYAFPGV